MLKDIPIVSRNRTHAAAPPVRGYIVKTGWARNLLTFLPVFGPGRIVMEADNDAGAVSASIQAEAPVRDVNGLAPAQRPGGAGGAVREQAVDQLGELDDSDRPLRPLAPAFAGVLPRRLDRAFRAGHSVIGVGPAPLTPRLETIGKHRNAMPAATSCERMRSLLSGLPKPPRPGGESGPVSVGSARRAPMAWGDPLACGARVGLQRRWRQRVAMVRPEM